MSLNYAFYLGGVLIDNCRPELGPQCVVDPICIQVLFFLFSVLFTSTLAILSVASLFSNPV